tara:strand:- start:1085 stop:1846 length:762 start_codon:yes stop_codon:yes gene_type:complete
MKLGFIGTGEITKAVVNGVINSKIKFSKIYISRRNVKNSNQIKKLNRKISVISDNQKIINKSEWIFLAVTPEIGRKILKKLKFKNKQIIISFISTIKMNELKKLINRSNIVRAIPLPPISIMKGPVPLYPGNKKVRDFFNKIGNSLEINNETSSLNFWAISSLMASYYEMLSEISGWLEKKGIKKQIAQKYVTSLYSALSDIAVLNSSKNLKILVKDSQTPKGLNEQTLKFLKKSGYYKKLRNSLDKILKSLN